MPDIQADLNFLADNPLYAEEKPFMVLVSPGTVWDPAKHSNLDFVTHSMTVTDIRGREKEFPLEECGFEVLNHKSQNTNFDNHDVRDVDAYKRETEELLLKRFDAVRVVCYEFRLRMNVEYTRREADLNDPFLLETPAKGAHNDSTMNSGPHMIYMHLSEEDRKLYLTPDYRLRLFNTWRTLNPICEDMPLALVDFRTLRVEDLIPADRILPDRAGEILYLKYNAGQKWCWLEKMTSEEPLLFIIYDTQAGSQARLCPHVPFANPRAPANALPRYSLETRNIVITKA